MAVWGVLLFGIFGISGIFSLHHRFGTTTLRFGYFVLTVCFVFLLARLRCVIERIVLMVLSAIFAVAFSASILGPGAFFPAKLAIMCGWFLAAAACGFWAIYSSSHAAAR